MRRPQPGWDWILESAAALSLLVFIAWSALSSLGIETYIDQATAQWFWIVAAILIAVRFLLGRYR